MGVLGVLGVLVLRSVSFCRGCRCFLLLRVEQKSSILPQILLSWEHGNDQNPWPL